MAGKPLIPDPEMPDAEKPELTEAFFTNARPMVEVFPELVAGLEAWQAEERRRRGQRGPQKAPTTVQLTLRVDRDVVDADRATGSGWQRGMNDALRSGIGGMPTR
jgi:uncharacterized protein (DUF4415 family)